MFAETKNCVAANVSVTAPDGWVLTSANDVITITGPVNGMKYVIQAVPGEGKSGVEGAGAALSQTLSGVEFLPASEGFVNELPTWTMVGKASNGETSVVLNLIKVPNGANLQVTFVGPMSASEQYDEQISSVLTSIKPLP